MTNEEFSNEFDVLYNSITSDQAPGLDEYEKSVFLTKAQRDLIREYFNPRVDGTNGGFDGSQKRQYDFSMLIKTQDLAKIESNNPFDIRSIQYSFPKDYFLSINEIVQEQDDNNNILSYSVIPISYSEYQRLMTKPYPYPPKRIVWRLLTQTQNDAPVAELIGKFINSNDHNFLYVLRYVKQPTPIVLINLTDDNLSIDGESKYTPCALPSQMHQEILERAVTLAKIAYQAGSTPTLAQQQQNRNNQQQR